MLFCVAGIAAGIRVRSMPKFGDYIKNAREAFGWTQDELADRMLGSRPNVQRIEKLAAPTIQGRTYSLLAKAFGMSTAEMDKAWKSKKLPTQNVAHKPHALLGRAIPIINRVMASRMADRTNLDHLPGIADGYVHAPQITDPEAFAWIVEGECMEPEYRPGEVVICSPNAKYVDGWDYFVQLNADSRSENTFKRVFQEGDNFRLKSINLKFADIVVHREQIHSMAKAVFVQHEAGPRGTKR
jgi:SOS-response transcriptional repressor LexA